MKRDKSRSETDFGGSGSLRGSGGIAKPARKLGIFAPSKGHLIDSQQDVGGEDVRQDTSVLAIIIDPFSISPKPSPNRNAVVGEQMRIPAAGFGTLLLGKYSVG